MIDPSRRNFIGYGVAAIAASMVPMTLLAETGKKVSVTANQKEDRLRRKFMALTEEEWKERLTAEQFDVLRKEGTERSGSSSLNSEKRKGIFHCAGCENPLFASQTKYESGTGWPSFYDPIDGAVETKTDYKLIWPRTEYHCARCGGHQGHVFKDGPEPTGLRYCNNGVALKFIPKEA